MKFIKLTSNAFELVYVWISAEKIVYMALSENEIGKFTEVITLDENKFFIKETPEQIIEMIEKKEKELDELAKNPYIKDQELRKLYMNVNETISAKQFLKKFEERRREIYKKEFPDEYKKMEESFKPITHDELDEWAKNNPPGSGPHTDEELRRIYRDSKQRAE